MKGFFNYVLLSHGGVRGVARKAFDILIKDRGSRLPSRLAHLLRKYQEQVRAKEKHLYEMEDDQKDGFFDFSDGPKISVIVPCHEAVPGLLKKSFRSVSEQRYPHWELILVGDAANEKKIRHALQHDIADDERIKTVICGRNKAAAEALGSGLEAVTGEYFAILSAGDMLDVTALYWLARVVSSSPETDCAYTDEAVLSADGKRLCKAFYKPDWSPEYYLSMMYTSRLTLYRTSLVRAQGGFRPQFGAAQEYDLGLRVSGRTDRIVHVPKALYHRRVRKAHAGSRASSWSRPALEEFLKNERARFEVEVCDDGNGHHINFLPHGNPLVSIVIPTANRTLEVAGKRERLIDAVCESVLGNTAYENYEIVVVHNGDLTARQKENFSSNRKIRLVEYASPVFNLSEKINLGAAAACGEYILLLNDDVRIISANWLTYMLGMVQRKGVGVVGAKLLFPEGTIQHAGVVLLQGVPVHPYYGQPAETGGYGEGVRYNRNYLAVTGACAITPKRLFDSVGGYSEYHPVNYNDIDYCLKLYKKGYRSVYLADVELLHYESVSRDPFVKDEERNGFLEEWGGEFRNDPYYNVNLSPHIPYELSA